MKYVLIEAINMFEHTVSLETKRLLKEQKFQMQPNDRFGFSNIIE